MIKKSVLTILATLLPAIAFAQGIDSAVIQNGNYVSVNAPDAAVSGLSLNVPNATGFFQITTAGVPTLKGSGGSLFYPGSNPVEGVASTTVANSATIDTTKYWQRITDAGAITGVILEAGTSHGQHVFVSVDKDAIGSVTLAAQGTSNVAGGTGNIIGIGETREFVWDATDAIWSPLVRVTTGTVVGNLTFAATSAKIIAGPTSLLFRNNADSATNISILDDGTTTINGGLFLPNAATAGKNLLVGASALPADVTNTAGYFFNGATGARQLSMVQATNDANGVVESVYKSRATDGSADVIAQASDTIYTQQFKASNGTTYDTAASIVVTVDGTPGVTADMPGAIDFKTSPDGSATAVSALKLGNDKTATFTGSLVSNTAGKTLSIKTGGAAATAGTAICNGASNVSVSTTSIAITSVPVFSLNTVGGTVGQLPHVTTLTAGTSFTFACTALDTSTYNYIIIQTA